MSSFLPLNCLLFYSLPSLALIHFCWLHVWIFHFGALKGTFFLEEAWKAALMLTVMFSARHVALVSAQGLKRNALLFCFCIVILCHSFIHSFKLLINLSIFFFPSLFTFFSLPSIHYVDTWLTACCQGRTSEISWRR